VRRINRGFGLRPLSAFFLLAYGISWLLWLPAVLGYLLRGVGLADRALLLFLGNFGPFVAALVVTATTGGAAGVQALLQRLWRWRVGLHGYLIALYGFPALGLSAVVFLGVASPQHALSDLPGLLVTVPMNVLTIFLVLGPLGEELGWRGFALPRLQVGRSALSASVVLGLLWALWHAPLALLPDWRNGLPLGPFLLLYPLYIIALSIIFTWVYNRTQGSVLIAMLLHSAFNYTVYFLDDLFGIAQYDPLKVLGVTTGVLWLVCLALVGGYGPALSHRGSSR
jgi:membrane protease YdiL (CAAX protease family)